MSMPLFIAQVISQTCVFSVSSCLKVERYAQQLNVVFDIYSRQDRNMFLFESLSLVQFKLSPFFQHFITVGPLV